MTSSSTDGLADCIRSWGLELGFQQIGIARPDLSEAGARLRDWIASGYHGDMDWIAAHADKRIRPEVLVPDTVRVIAVRMDYWRDDAYPAARLDAESDRAWVSRYALGRDYHRVLRHRLRTLAGKIAAAVGTSGYRVFVDSAPVMEKAIAQQAGLGWIGKHTNVINRDAGSWFFQNVHGPAASSRSAGNDHPKVADLQMCARPRHRGALRPDARRHSADHKRGTDRCAAARHRQSVFSCDDCQLNPNGTSSRVRRRNDSRRVWLDRAAPPFCFCADEATCPDGDGAIRRAGYRGWLRNLRWHWQCTATEVILTGSAARRPVRTRVRARALGPGAPRRRAPDGVTGRTTVCAAGPVCCRSVSLGQAGRPQVPAGSAMPA